MHPLKFLQTALHPTSSLKTLVRGFSNWGVPEKFWGHSSQFFVQAHQRLLKRAYIFFASTYSLFEDIFWRFTLRKRLFCPLIFTQNNIFFDVSLLTRFLNLETFFFGNQLHQIEFCLSYTLFYRHALDFGSHNKYVTTKF